MILLIFYSLIQLILFAEPRSAHFNDPFYDGNEHDDIKATTSRFVSEDSILEMNEPIELVKSKLVNVEVINITLSNSSHKQQLLSDFHGLLLNDIGQEINDCIKTAENAVDFVFETTLTLTLIQSFIKKVKRSLVTKFINGQEGISLSCRSGLLSNFMFYMMLVFVTSHHMCLLFVPLRVSKVIWGEKGRVIRLICWIVSVGIIMGYLTFGSKNMALTTFISSVFLWGQLFLFKSVVNRFLRASYALDSCPYIPIEDINNGCISQTYDEVRKLSAYDTSLFSFQLPMFWFSVFSFSKKVIKKPYDKFKEVILLHDMNFCYFGMIIFWSITFSYGILKLISMLNEFNSTVVVQIMTTAILAVMPHILEKVLALKMKERKKARYELLKANVKHMVKELIREDPKLAQISITPG